jgi:hypothetical protein
MALNSPQDENCISCGRSLDRAGRIERAERAERYKTTPAWAYFFATLCGIIPVFTLGGIVPVGIGVAGIAGCMAVGRAKTVPSPLRILTCIFIVAGCWIGLLMFLGALAKAMKKY